MPAPLHAVVLAAGEGKRLGGARPKVLTPIWGRPALVYPLLAVSELAPASLVVVVGEHRERIAAALGARPEVAGAVLARQAAPRGTGDAVLAARTAIPAGAGELLVLNGDMPLVPAEALAALLSHHRKAGAAVSVLTMRPDDPARYGRLERDGQGAPRAITEAADASPSVLALDEVSAGVFVLSLPWAWEALAGLGHDNAQGEVYLPDVLARARGEGRPVAALCWSRPEDLLGFNDHGELALVRAILHERLVAGHLARGVEIVDPDTTWVDADVELAPGCRVLPCTVIEGRVSVAAGCEVGPFAHLRDGTVLEAGAEVGNFVETKQARLGRGTKAKHLTYLGDATIGSSTNIGAGTITANYDGTRKHATVIGDGAFIGSGTVIVAPAEVRDRARTGAGAIVKRASVVGEGETWVGVPARRLDAPVGETRPEDGPQA